ncbi:MAG TPA: hypothetical protein VFS43_39110 [Polyangiaceae bacterium]|nr:hypothetical protein [Polyangiaceae bacterium]
MTPRARGPAPAGQFRRKAFVRLAAFVAPWALARPAAAAPPGARHPSVHVLELAHEGERDVARALTDALRLRVHLSRDYALGDSDLSLKVAVAPCLRGSLFDKEGAPREPSPGCLEQVGTALQDKLQARKPPFLWGHLVREGGASRRLRVRLHLWREGQADAKADYAYEREPADAKSPPFDDVAEWLLRRLLDGEARAARVRVRSAGALEGELYADGEARGRLESGGVRELVLEPGVHSFEVRRGDRVLAHARALARVGDEAPAEVQLAPPAVAAARPRPAPPPPPPPPPPTPWPWVFGGAGLAGLAGAGVLFALRQGVEGDLEEACDTYCPSRERGAVARSNRLGGAALLAATAGVAGLGAGVTLWAFERQEAAGATASWRVRATVGPVAGGAGAGLSGRF